MGLLPGGFLTKHLGSKGGIPCEEKPTLPVFMMPVALLEKLHLIGDRSHGGEMDTHGVP